MDDTPTILLLGDSSRAEFAGAVEQMRATCRVIEFADVADAIACCQRGAPPPILAVIAVSRPGQFSDDAIARLRQRLPLVPLVALLGAWCEGEVRSGAPWPGVVRVYWHQWPQRYAQESARLIAGQSGSWSLPDTASAEERLLGQVDTSPGRSRGLVAVVAERREVAEWLVTTCRHAGWATLWNAHWPWAETHGADLALWDAGLIDGQTQQVLRQIGDTFGNVPVVALTDFPRSDDRQRLAAAGVAAVLSKPLLASDLAWQLERLAPAPSATYSRPFPSLALRVRAG